MLWMKCFHCLFQSLASCLLLSFLRNKLPTDSEQTAEPADYQAVVTDVYDGRSQWVDDLKNMVRVVLSLGRSLLPWSQICRHCRRSTDCSLSESALTLSLRRGKARGSFCRSAETSWLWLQAQSLWMRLRLNLLGTVVRLCCLTWPYPDWKASRKRKVASPNWNIMRMFEGLRFCSLFA